MQSSAVETLSEQSLDPPVRGFLHRPTSPSGNGLVLTHGAGGNAKMALLTALAEAFTGAGFTVLRCDLPFRQARPYGPPRPGNAARDRAGLRNALTALRRFAPERIFLGGQSYGGRQASMLLSEERVADGLLLLSYPLHAPNRPDQPRTQHLPKLEVPTLFVHGSKDPFGSIEEIEAARQLIPGKTQLVAVESAGHDLGFKGKKQSQDMPELVLRTFGEFFL